MKQKVNFILLTVAVLVSMPILFSCTSSHAPLTGVWLASYPGGPLKVKINQSGDDVIATLLEGNAFVPAGKETFSGKFHPELFEAQQICAYPGFQNPYLVNVTIKIIDNDHFIESLAPDAHCGGFPVNWERIKQ